MSFRPRLPALALPLAAVVAFGAGCGGSSPASPPVASVASGTTTPSTAPHESGPSTASGDPGGGQSLAIAGGKAQDAAKFAACMRKHGVPNFPDPSGRGALTIGPSSGIDLNSPTFQAAQQTCRKLLPNGGQPSPAQIAAAKQHALAFSACMRKHGVHDFPDPSFSSNGGGIGITIHGSRGSDLDPNSPTFQTAMRACQADLPGKIAPAPPSGSSGGK
jgi:hypothetical protein